MPSDIIRDFEAVNRGFTRQSYSYDEADRKNIILQDLRKQVYEHLQRFLHPQSRILELNAGTGIDAEFLARQGHFVHATDLADGMVGQIKKKIITSGLSDRLTCEQVSYDHLDCIQGRTFDLVFSNFGGLNCIENLARVTRHLPKLLTPGGYIVWVIMPKVCPWEIAWCIKGNWSKAFRRLRDGGSQAHIEGEFFQTYYHSLKDIRSALGPAFKLMRAESLALFSPPPHATNFVEHHPAAYKFLRSVDALVKSNPPFNRWGDHIIVSFRFEP